MASASAPTQAKTSELGGPPLFAFGRERRMHARAYDYWVSLLRGRRMPGIADVDPDSLADFSERSVLIDIPRAGGSPTVAFLGRALRDEAGVATPRPTIGDIPPGTLLAELLRRFSDIVAYQAPVGFEAEFSNRGGDRLLHRGILLPFADANGALASVYGVMSWKQVAMTVTPPDIGAAIDSVMASRASPPVSCAWGDGPGAVVTTPALPPQPAEQQLATARTWAALAATDRTRSDASLHAALGAAYDYLLAAHADAPAGARTVIRLVFGAELGRLDRIRYTATLAHARRLGLGKSRVPAWLDGLDGGHVAAARAERRARRAERLPAELAEQRAWADAQPPLGHIELSPVDEDYLVLLGRRAPHGVEVIAPVPADDLFTGAALARARAG